MGVILAKENNMETAVMRDVYAATLMELAAQDERIVALDADLMNSMGMMPFAKKFPQRTIDCGIQEANMIGTAAGLSAVGMVPFAHTFGCFASRRVADQIFVSAAYAGLNVKIIGSDPGVTAAFNGATHMPFEDVAIMRSIPDVTVLEPVDTVMLADLVKQMAKEYGVYYLRLSRKNGVQVYEEGSTFTIGKGVVVREGTDVTIFATGICVADCLLACDILKEKGISAKVVNIFTIKPLDAECVVQAARQTGAVVTAENHNVIGGLGSAVAEALGEGCPVPMQRIGVQDEFGEVGPVEYLKERFHLMPKDIAAAAEKAVARKEK